MNNKRKSFLKVTPFIDCPCKFLQQSRVIWFKRNGKTDELFTFDETIFIKKCECKVLAERNNERCLCKDTQILKQFRIECFRRLRRRFIEPECVSLLVLSDIDFMNQRPSRTKGVVEI